MPTAELSWPDPLSYTKPSPVDVAMPDEATTVKLCVDVDSGSGDSCTESNPCALDGVNTTGPAYVYVRGSKQLVGKRRAVHLHQRALHAS